MYVCIFRVAGYMECCKIIDQSQGTAIYNYPLNRPVQAIVTQIMCTLISTVLCKTD